MPNIKEISEQKKKKFHKSPYRAWNFSAHVDKTELDVFSNEKSRSEVIEDNAPTNNNEEQKQLSKKNETSYQNNAPLPNREQSVSDPLANDEFADSNPLPNREQSVSDPLARHAQAVSDPLAIREQSVSETVSKTVSNPLAKPLATNDELIGDGSDDILIKNINMNRDYLEIIFSLSNKEKQLLNLIVLKCKEHCSLSSPPISTEEIRENLKISATHVRNLVHRMSKKNIISVEKNKSGRNANRKFKLDKNLYRHIQETIMQINQNREQTVSKTVSNPLAKPLEPPPVVVSSYINTTTNLGIDMPEGWQSLNIEPLEPYGFSQSHAKQLCNWYEKNPSVVLSLEEVQNSIYEMAYDLKHNNVAKDFRKPPVVILMSMLKKAQPYNSVTPEKYLSPRDEAMQKYKQIEAERKERELKQMQELKELELKHWQETLPEEELLAFCPDSEIQAGIPDKVRLAMRRKKALELSAHYFDSAVWPIKVKEIHEYAPLTLTQNEKVKTNVD